MAKDPSQITGLVEWWDPDDIAGADGDAIGTWTGKNGINFLGAGGANNPDLVAATRELTAHKTLKLSGTERMTAANAGLHAGQMTVAAMVAGLSFNTTSFIYAFDKANTNPLTFSLRYDLATREWWVRFRLDGTEGTLRNVIAAYEWDAKPTLLIARYDGTEMILRVNGTEIGATAIAGALDADSPGNLTLGNHTSTFARGGDTRQGDFAIYNVAVSDADILELEEWFTTRWALDTYYDAWTTGLTSNVFSVASNSLFSPCIRELDVNTWICFAAIVPDAQIDYWTAPKSDPHNWTRNPGGPIITAALDSPPDCRGVSAVLDGSTWHILVDGADGSLYHFTGTNLGALTDNGAVFSGTGISWEQFVRAPDIATTKVGSDWAVYYDGRQGTPTSGIGAIGVVYTTDFVTFTNRQQVLAPSDLWYEDDDVGSPAVRFRNGRWEMVYAGYAQDWGGSNFPHYAGLALSDDGTAWTKIGSVPVATPRADSRVNQRINNVELFDDGTNQWLYLGNNAPSTSIVRLQLASAFLNAAAFDPANLVAVAVGSDVTLTWDPSW